MKAIFSLFISVLWAFAVFGQSQTQTAPQAQAHKTSRKTAPIAKEKETVAHAEWNQYWQYSLGITETEFNDAGLQQLTTEQMSKLFLAMLQHRPVFSRGVTYGSKETEEYHYVHLHVSGTDDDAEFVGRLRLKLSAIRDVKLVPSDEDADLAIRILTVPNEVGSRKVGITVSTVVSEPCVYRVNGGWEDGAQKFMRVLDGMINAGGDDDEVASRIANTLEARDFDATRQNHAQTLKLLQK